MYGEERMDDRPQATERLIEIHEDCAELPTSTFIAETWARMTFQYNICVAEGVRYIIGQYDDGITFGKLRRSALTP